MDTQKPLAGTLEMAMNRADQMAVAEGAPAIRLDHFLAALVFESYRAGDVARLLAKWDEEWAAENR